MCIPHRYSLHYNASNDAHWGRWPESTLKLSPRTNAYIRNPEQLPNVQALMNVQGFKACYLVNCEELTRSTIVGDRSYVTGTQLVLLSASLQVGQLEQLTIRLSHADILVRHTPNLQNYACVLILDKLHRNGADGMAALKIFCDQLT